MYSTCGMVNALCGNIRFNQTPPERFVGPAKTCVKSGAPGNGLWYRFLAALARQGDVAPLSHIQRMRLHDVRNDKTHGPAEGSAQCGLVLVSVMLTAKLRFFR